MIAGNHELTFDPSGQRMAGSTKNLQNKLMTRGLQHMFQLITNAVYLQDSAVKLHNLTIYGSPW